MKIVAPAGNMQRLVAAIKAGADEIYLGLKGFGARRNAINFSMQELKEAIDFAHKRGTKLFLTLNTIMMDNEIDFLYNNIKELYEYGLDAIIVQDLGFAKYLKENFPNIELHASTQMKISNHIEVNFLKQFGFTRVVLPRELSFEEIKKIRENTDMELEIFVSGSLCICISGNCYLSSFIGRRSGNRGMCAQPCRKIYKDSEDKSSYLLSPKDQLLSFDEIKKLKDIGIDSIKIEGRMKDETYVFETVSYYKNLIKENNVNPRTNKIFNRGYANGYFYGRDKDLINHDYSFNMGEEIGEPKNNILILKTNLNLGDGITFVDRNFEKISGTYVNKIILNKNKDSVRKANIGDEILLDIPKNTKFIFKSYNKEVNDEIKKNMINKDKKIEINAKFIAKINDFAKLIFYFYDKNNYIEEIVFSNQKCEIAQKKAIDKNVIEEKIKELGDTNFILNDIEIDIDDNVFLPISTLKDLKRQASKKLEDKYLNTFKRKLDIDKNLMKFKKDNEKDSYLSIIYRDENQLNIINKVKSKYNIKYLYKKTDDNVKENQLDNVDLNINLASNIYQAISSKNKVLLNWNLNICNSYSIKFLENIKNIDGFIISPELSFEKISNLCKTRLRKALLVYSKLKGMTIDYDISKNDKEIITNKENDKFKIQKNKNYTELFLEKELNIINDLDKLKYLCVDEYIIELTDENEEEIIEILNQTKTKKGIYRAYNYEKGVF